jgi:hypothetical protein
MPPTRLVLSLSLKVGIHPLQIFIAVDAKSLLEKDFRQYLIRENEMSEPDAFCPP